MHLPVCIHPEHTRLHDPAWRAQRLYASDRTPDKADAFDLHPSFYRWNDDLYSEQWEITRFLDAYYLSVIIERQIGMGYAWSLTMDDNGHNPADGLPNVLIERDGVEATRVAAADAALRHLRRWMVAENAAHQEIEATCDAHDIAERPPLRAITQIGLDGASQPILRYTDEMHLGDHARSIVSPQDRARTMTDAQLRAIAPRFPGDTTATRWQRVCRHELDDRGIAAYYARHAAAGTDSGD